MDYGWIQTWGSDAKASVQISIASKGGSGTDVPDISIEVENLQAVFDLANQHGASIEYGPVTEPWGVKRFYLRDPFGKLVNVLQHL